MANPIFSWRKGDNSESLASWDIGVVDAGITPASATETEILIWNNRNETENPENEDVNDAYNVRIISTDVNGNVNAVDSPEVVKNDWVESKCDSMSESSFTAIGRDLANPTLPVYKKISAVGTTINTGGNQTLAMPTVDDDTTYKILGCKNDGSINAQANYAKVTLRANIPSIAIAGNFDFLIKCIYQHI
jgi:hypothetical protein